MSPEKPSDRLLSRPAGVLARRSQRRGRRLGAGLVVTAAALLLGGCNGWPAFGESNGATTQGHDIAKLYSGMFIAGVAVAALVWALIFWCVIAYRKKRRAGIPRQFQEHIPLEITYTVIPIIIVIVIFVFTVITENSVDAVSKHPDVTVDVTAYQWGWIFRYEHSNGLVLRTAGGAGQPGKTSNPYLPAKAGYTASVYPQLVLPEHETTKIVLRSDDVVHDFYVQAFDFDRFAQPGVVNKFDFTPTQTGVFPGQCSEYCGLFHSEMLFSVRVVSPSKFNQWRSYYETHTNVTPKHYALTQQ